MNFKKLLTGLSIALLGAFLLSAKAVAADAKILKKVGTGTATALLADGTSQVLNEKSTVPQGATIVTGADVELYIETVEGAITAIKANSKVLVEKLDANNAILDLQAGKVASQLDKTRMTGHTYGVRTPKGVAAARGTNFTVTVNGAVFTVATFAGRVEVTNTAGQVVSIGAGQISISTNNGGAATAIGSLSSPADIQVATDAAAAALAAVATVTANTSGTFSQSAATDAGGELKTAMGTVATTLPPESVTQVAVAAAKAAPSQAANIVSAAVEAAAATPSTLNTVVKAVTEGAAQGAAATTTTPDQAKAVAADVAKAAVDAVKNSGASGQTNEIAKVAAESSATGATHGAIQNQGTGAATEIAAGVAAGAALGASQSAPGAAGDIAASAATGATQGATNSGTQINTQTVANQAASGASQGSGTTVAPPAAPTQPAQITPPQTPQSPINPDISISPSGD